MPGNTEAKLSDEARTFVVQALACFDPPSAVAAAVKEEFKISITPQAIEAYNPTKRAGRFLSAKWKALFEETRAAFLKDAATIGIAHRSVRLRALDRMAERAEKMGNLALAKDLHEQAAKEVGNVYTNKRELGGPDGGAIPVDAGLDELMAMIDGGTRTLTPKG